MRVDRSEDLGGETAISRFAALPVLLSIDEVCALLDVHRNTLRRWRLRGFGPVGYAVGGSWIYREDEVLAWLRDACPCCRRMHETSDAGFRS